MGKSAVLGQLLQKQRGRFEQTNYPLWWQNVAGLYFPRSTKRG
jgi:hypothetical protein